MHPIAEVGDAALHALGVHLQVLEHRPLAVTDFEQFPAVMKGEFVMMLTTAVDHHAFRSRIGAHRILDAGCQRSSAVGILFKGTPPPIVTGPKEEHIPAS